MPRYIDADALYEQAAEWEASALAYIRKLNPNKKPYAAMSAEERDEWNRWTAICGERSAFKFDVADSPTADVVSVVRCKNCEHWDEEFEECDCPKMGRRVQVPAGFYCGWGERRDDE